MIFWLKWLLMAAAVLAVLGIAAGRMGWLGGQVPGDLGVHEGRLKPPSATPNSATSQADLYPDHPQRDYARVAPFPLKGDAAQSIQRLQAILRGMDGVQVVRSDTDYLHAQCTTKLLRFVDDLEFWADPATRVIHVRSASRLGRRDFGVNRARIEAIRARYEQSS